MRYATRRRRAGRGGGKSGGRMFLCRLLFEVGDLITRYGLEQEAVIAVLGVLGVLLAITWFAPTEEP